MSFFRWRVTHRTARNNAEFNFKLTKTHESIIKDIYLLNVDAKTKLELATNLYL